MDALAPFRIPLASLKSGEAHYDWELDSSFIRLFDDTHEAEKGQFQVALELVRTGNVTTLEFKVSGVLNTSCDRCLAPIDLPFEGAYEIIVKLGDPKETTDEVLYIDPEANGLNVGQLIYDFILLSIPISRRIPGCETMTYPPCDMTVLSFLSENNSKGPASDDSLWEDLRKVTDN